MYPRSGFIGTLVELRAPSNAHFYFDELTAVRRGSIVVDIGASEGSFALECLVRHNAAHVWCFEPNSSMNRALEATAERNHLAERLHIVPAAAARTTGGMEMLETATDPLAAFRIDRVPAAGQKDPPGVLRKVEGVSLDDWAAQTSIERMDNLKIDAEGSDQAVLQGARMCLERWRPAIAVTTYHQANHCNEMIEYLSSLDLGYRFRVDQPDVPLADEIFQGEPVPAVRFRDRHDEAQVRDHEALHGVGSAAARWSGKRLLLPTARLRDAVRATGRSPLG